MGNASNSPARASVERLEGRRVVRFVLLLDRIAPGRGKTSTAVMVLLCVMAVLTRGKKRGVLILQNLVGIR